MRRATVLGSALLSALSVAATGCGFSSVDPDADVRVSGTALTASGAPLADAQVLLFKQADLGEVIFGSVLAVGTLGTICLLPEAPALCDRAQRTTTDAQGRFSFDLTGEDTQGTLGTAATMNVVFSAGRGRTSTTISFTADAESVSLPPARLWNPDPKVTGGGPVRLTWKPLRGSGEVRYSAHLFDARGRSAIWTEAASGSSATLDARILEDRPGTAAVGASVELGAAEGAGEARVDYLSTRLPVRGGAGRPPSRGKRCAPVTGTGPVATGRYDRCGLTDGELDAPARLLGAGEVVTGGVVDLGARRPIDFVVARGFSGQLLLEVSDDGRAFRVVATGSGTAVALEPNAPTSARYVRLRSPSGVDQALGYEISVW